MCSISILKSLEVISKVEEAKKRNGMQEYEGVESDMPIAYEVYITTTANTDGQKNEKLSKKLQIAP